MESLTEIIVLNYRNDKSKGIALIPLGKVISIRNQRNKNLVWICRTKSFCRWEYNMTQSGWKAAPPCDPPV